MSDEEVVEMTDLSIERVKVFRQQALSEDPHPLRKIEETTHRYCERFFRTPLGRAQSMSIMPWDIEKQTSGQ
jgi:hypothetical protein